MDTTQKATAAFTPGFRFPQQLRETQPVTTLRGELPSVSPKAGVTLHQNCLHHVRHWQSKRGTFLARLSEGCWAPISLALNQQLIIHTLLMRGMHLWDIYQGLKHNLWLQNKGNLADPHGTRTETWPLGPTRQPEEINHPRTSLIAGVSRLVFMALYV